jgi:hypothetical protein
MAKALKRGVTGRIDTIALRVAIDFATRNGVNYSNIKNAESVLKKAIDEEKEAAAAAEAKAEAQINLIEAELQPAAADAATEAQAARPVAAAVPREKSTMRRWW